MCINRPIKVMLLIKLCIDVLDYSLFISRFYSDYQQPLIDKNLNSSKAFILVHSNITVNYELHLFLFEVLLGNICTVPNCPDDNSVFNQLNAKFRE